MFRTQASAAKGAAVSTTYSLPAPIGGLNARDAISAMPEKDCIAMENWFPQTNYVEVRNGYVKNTTGFSGWVESLMSYSNASTRKLFAACGTAFYDASSAGAVGAAVVSGLTNARWEHVNIGTPGGQYLYAFNGVDKPRLYDGATWVAVDGVSAPAITGVTTTKLCCPAVWKNRLWMVEDGTFKAWYLPTQSVGGAASSIDFGSLFKRGGKLQAIITTSIDQSNGLDDYIGFLSSEGELALYRGTDPAVAATFGLVGMFRIGRPIGRRCHFRYGADVIIICADGFVALSKLLTGLRGPEDTLSYKILNLVNSDVQSYNANFGWQGLLHPIGNKVVINVPTLENTTQYQYVMNTVTNAWTKFTGWNGACWELHGDGLYFGGNTYVARADYGMIDGTNSISAKIKQAFSYFGSKRQKKFNLIRPVILTNGTTNLGLSLNVDYADTAPVSTPTSTATTASPWDSSPWDTSPWGGSESVQKQWQTITGVGFAASTVITAATIAPTIKLLATDYVFEQGGVL